MFKGISIHAPVCVYACVCVCVMCPSVTAHTLCVPGVRVQVHVHLRVLCEQLHGLISHVLWNCARFALLSVRNLLVQSVLSICLQVLVQKLCIAMH
jgi:hypothetical protein